MFRTRVTITGVGGPPWLSIMHFTAATEDLTSATNAIAKAKAFWHEMISVWLPGTSWTANPVVDQVRATDGQLIGQFTVTGATEVGIVSGSDSLPPAVQAMVRWSTADFVNGRRVTGRTFIPGLLESSNASGGVPGGQLVTTNAPNAIGALLAAGDATFTIWSRPKTNPATLGTTHTVTAGQLATKFAVLRSRRD